MTNVSGLVVAGGAGERMLRSGGTMPKPLMRVRGVALLERNVFALLRAGLTDIHVAASATAEAVLRFARSRCREIAEALGARLAVIAEHQRLGSVGPAAFLNDRDAVLIVNADNLTSLDLRDVLAAHRESGAALTLAVHNQPFQIPFGEVRVETDRLVAYREKPTLLVPICSAVSVLGGIALAALRPGEHIGLPAFTNRLLDAGAEVRAFFHCAPWIDVNDLAAVAQADALVTAHAEAFERWPGRPDREAAAVILHGRHGVALDRVDNGVWRLPTARIEARGDPRSAAMRLVEERVGVPAASPNVLAVFDDIDIVSGGVTRVHVFSADVTDRAMVNVRSWIRPEAIAGRDDVAPLVSRALAMWPGR